MAISFVGAGTAQQGLNPTIPVPSGYASGDLFILHVNSGTAPTTPTGWTLLTSYTSTNPQTYTYYKTAGATEVSVVLVDASTTTAAVIIAYRGTAGFEAANTYSYSAATSATSITTSGTLRTTNANDFIISFFDSQSTSRTWTAPASTNTRVNLAPNGTARGILIVDELQVSAGTITSRTASMSGTNGFSCVPISIYPTATNIGNFFFMFN